MSVQLGESENGYHLKELLDFVQQKFRVSGHLH